MHAPKNLDLNGSWRFLDSAPQAMDGTLPAPPSGSEGDWLSVSFPGDLNAALARAGRMPDPHVADNGRQGYWVSAREWWCRRTFVTPPGARPYDLVLDGVDGIAEVYLNGALLGKADNAFHPHRFPVGDRLRSDAPNELTLRFYAIDAVIGHPRNDAYWGGWGEDRGWMRKPQFNFGWDWSLPLPGVGILGGIGLEETARPRFIDVALQPFVSGRVDVDFAVNREAKELGTQVRFRIHGHGADVRDRQPCRGYRFYATVRIPRPRLWWPRGMGKANLYAWTAELVAGDRVVDRRDGRLGLREVAIDEAPFTPDAGPGRAFGLRVNGRRVFCKGGNWIPTELWPAEARDETTRWLLQKAADANFNMMRVWGGGIYEKACFYDACDELGLMVWQDFMFASGGYPLEALRASIVREAQYQLRRLRNRACIVLWCGCNEDVFSWHVPGDPDTVDRMADADIDADGPRRAHRYRDDPQLYTMLLRGLVSRYGLGIPYVESSPMSHDDVGNDPRSGNSHVSCLKHLIFDRPNEPWRFREHFDQTCSFDSEFCIHGPSAESSMRRFLTEAHAWPPDDVWTYHIQKGHKGLAYHDQIQRFAGGVFGPIGGLAAYVKHGQALHLEMMRAEFDAARRDRPNSGGTMMWMHNDCWPTSNWSIIDYYRVPKPAYYAARRGCAPVLPIVMERRGRFEWFLSNDRPGACRAEAELGWMCLDGTVLRRRRARCTVGGQDTVRLYACARSDVPLGPGVCLFLRLRVAGRRLPTVTYFPDGWKHVPWPPARFRVHRVRSERMQGGWTTVLRVTAETYLRLFHVDAATPRGEAWVDDNDFDLPAGESRLVTLTSARKIAERDLRFRTWTGTSSGQTEALQSRR